MPDLVNKEVKYLNKNFDSLLQNLVEFSKVYFPDTYSDFSPSTIGRMFIEMSAYVGDVLCYYIDNSMKENLLEYAEDRRNVIALASALGYKYRTKSPSYTTIDVFQIIPSKGVNGSEIDFKYALKINKNMVIRSTMRPNVFFRTLEHIDFSVYDYNDDFVSQVYELDNYGNPLFYLLKKTVSAVAGEIYVDRFTFGDASPFSTITLPYNDVIEIIDVVDSNGNTWYEVDYLAQDTVSVDIENNAYTNTQYYDSSSMQYTPYILKTKKVDKRFVVKKDVSSNTILQFGSGVSSYADSVLIPNYKTLQYNTDFTNFLDQSNKFISTISYGTAPSNVTLTVRYTRGGGLESNIPQGDLTTISGVVYTNNDFEYVTSQEKQILETCKQSLSVINRSPAYGGKDEETVEEIKNNAMLYFNSQNRCITSNDYLSRALSMPEKYGGVAKAYVEKDESNSLVINIYTLGYDINKKLAVLNNLTKQNLIAYIDKFKSLTDAINIKDAYIINIAVKFSIIHVNGYNKNDVILKCIDALKSFFAIDKWQIGKPIIIKDIYDVLNSVDGVRSAYNLIIENKYDPTAGYSNNYYHIPSATRDGVIYTSQDPSIFEVRFPNTDIQGN